MVGVDHRQALGHNPDRDSVANKRIENALIPTCAMLYDVSVLGNNIALFLRQIGLPDLLPVTEPCLVVFDLDGTLTDHSHRLYLVENKPVKWKEFQRRCEDDLPVAEVIALAAWLGSEGFGVEIWSGRSAEVQPATMRWLEKHDVYYDLLLLRPDGDSRPSNELKGEWLAQLPQPPVFAVDDRPKCAQWWETQGVPCLPVPRIGT